MHAPRRPHMEAALHVLRYLKNSPGQGIKTDETPLFLATTWSITELVEEILKIYPQAVEHVNKKGRNILHVAIQYRQMKIFDMVTRNDMRARRLLRATDAQGNSLLHTVSKNRKGLIMETSQGPALDLQDQLLLFEKVKKLVKSDFFRLFNHKNQTAQELFADNYSKLHEDSKKWLEETSKNCTIVAVLIATVAFAAAYTVPGGNQQSSGIPVLLSNPFFVVFTLADVISLTFALTSVVSFLSIITSPFRLQDFKYSLPQKLMLAFTFLILSVTMMMVAFAATIILMIHDKESWSKIALYSVAFLPVLVFALSYSNLYAHLVKACSHLLQIIQEICPRCKGNRPHRNESRCMSSSNHPDESHRSSFRRPSTPQITEV
uniref:PGG domain-containing protein n=1 Tax=Vitis vinifera TaxID=29760 RepID=F6H6B4_VITVI